ncbi:MAG: hypothetical protein ACTSP2_05580, partial [Alphaproteobacteria bacterium]
TEVQAPAFFSGSPSLEPVEAQLSRQIAIDLVQLYVTEVQNDLDIRFNQNALEQIASGAPSGAPRPSLPTGHGG